MKKFILIILGVVIVASILYFLPPAPF